MRPVSSANACRAVSQAWHAADHVCMVLPRLLRRTARRWRAPATDAVRAGSMAGGLQRAARRGIAVRTVIDVGASDGRWTELALRHFPNAQYLLIEAQPAHRPALETFAAQRPNVEYALAAAGHRNGTIHFAADRLFGGVASEAPLGASSLTVPVRTIDSLVKERGLAGPYLLKLDTHGFELPIFDGAAATLRDTALMVVEAYNFSLTPSCLRFHELIAHFERHGFRVLDVCEVSRRPKDDVLWQMDLFLARAARPEFADVAY
jgi:FkbM family methyltransferase